MTLNHQSQIAESVPLNFKHLFVIIELLSLIVETIYSNFKPLSMTIEILMVIIDKTLKYLALDYIHDFYTS